MKTTALEIQVQEHDRDISEKFIQPATPEQPLIKVTEIAEKECFESAFALELAGIGRKMKSREDIKKEVEKKESNQDRYKKEMLSGLAENQILDFIYTGGRDKRGKPFIKWTIRGRSEASTSDEAVSAARRLWQNLNVITGTLRNEYAFTPVIEEKKLREEGLRAGWIARLVRTGIAINTDPYVPMGFVRHQAVDRNKATVIVAPEKGFTASPHFDSLALGAAGCASEVTLVLSMSRVNLSEDDLRKVASSLRWLRNGEMKQIRFHEGMRDGIDDKDLMASLEATLALWMGNPTGYRVSCAALSQEPIPLSFLKLIGSELFQGSFTVEHRKVKEEPIKQLNSAADETNVAVLDLQDCINNSALLPPLFPRVETLHTCNVKRAFVNDLGYMNQNGILLGRVGQGATSKPVRFSNADRSRHAYIIGSTGTGKSTLLFNMIKQDIDNGEGVCLIDPHGDLHQQVLRAVPKSRAEDVVIVDPSDFDNAVGINFMETGEFNKNMQMNFAVNELIKIFDRLFDLRTTGGPIFEQYMRNAMLLLMDNTYTGATLCDIPLLFEDQEFRKFLKKGCKSPLVESFWTLMAERAGGDASLVNVAPYITSKLTPFVYNALLRPIIGQPKSTINFREIMDKRQILLVNLSKGMLGEMDTQLLGMIIIGKIFSSAMGRVSMRPEDRKPFYLYVDEFQNFTTDSVAFLLSEARKFSISLTLANQNLAQLRSNNGQQNILDAVLGNVGSMFMLRMGVLDSDTLKLYTKPDIDAQDLQNLPDFNVAARLMSRNAPTKPFVFTTLPATKDGNDDLALEIRTLSANKYTRITKLVEKEIVARRTAYKKANEQQVVNA